MGNGTAAAAPPAQKEPAGQALAVELVEPAAHANPGAAEQGRHAAADCAPAVDDHVPPGQGMGAAAGEPGGQ
jgi:hypothetical protein